ncbi:MAG: hypothetical protein ACLUFW_10825 [Alistipes sp.]
MSFKYYLIEVNPRVSRSSALASQGQRLSDRARYAPRWPWAARSTRSCSPTRPPASSLTLDYVVTKDARASRSTSSATRRNKLGTQMKATGEVMAIGRTMEESLLKAVRSLEIGRLPHLPARSSTT